jgi:hypothetical protein
MEKLLAGLCVLLLIVFAIPSPSNADSVGVMTWVSASGTDSGSCNTPALACATLLYAYNHTEPGGAINCISPNFSFSSSTITITHAITIDCRDANFLLDGFGTDAITVNAGSNDDVTLRGLRFDGDGSIDIPDLTGVKFNSGGSLHIEDCTFTNYSTAGVSIAPNTASKVFIADTKIKANASGVLIKPSTGGSVAVSFNHLAITSNTGGGMKIDTTSGPITVDVTDSEISGNAGNGMNAVGGAGGPAMFNIHDSVIAKNGAAGVQVNGATAAAMLDTTLLDSNANGATAVVNGGHMLTYGNNRIVGTLGSGFTGSASLQ